MNAQRASREDLREDLASNFNLGVAAIWNFFGFDSSRLYTPPCLYTWNLIYIPNR